MCICYTTSVSPFIQHCEEIMILNRFGYEDSIVVLYPHSFVISHFKINFLLMISLNPKICFQTGIMR